ncbi:hypothetical protein PVAND_016112 [Polypedilum vanderplanki]|uniref:F-box domain-containing protein n=1 Tax=Polypedilum vanderplanki TaxID=319348 RepID=A0A9J6BEW2_POLVA|nr:hypothetical protein PVAND_016112 [Polypedilum vanderplanki]
MSQGNQKNKKIKLDFGASGSSIMEEQNKKVYDFPIEILVKIIGYIPEHRRKDFSIVSKSFNEAVNIVDERKPLIYRCASELPSTIDENCPDCLVDYEKFINSDSEECQVRVSSINEAVMNFFKEHGKKVTNLRFLGLVEFSNYIETLKLVPNCKVLNINNLQCKEESGSIFEKVAMFKLKKLSFKSIYRCFEKFYKCFECPNLENLAFFESNLNIVSENFSQIKNLTLIHRDGYTGKLENLNLESFSLTECNIKNTFDYEWIETQKNLQHLTIARLPGRIYKEEPKDLEIPHKNIKNLKSLNFACQETNLEFLQEISIHKDLTFLSLEISKIDVKVEILKSLSTSFRNLKYLALNIKKHESRRILVDIWENFKQLESLNLSSISSGCFCCQRTCRELPNFDFYLTSDCQNLLLNNLQLDNIDLPFSIAVFKKLSNDFPNLKTLEFLNSFVIENNDRQEEEEDKNDSDLELLPKIQNSQDKFIEKKDNQNSEDSSLTSDDEEENKISSSESEESLHSDEEEEEEEENSDENENDFGNWTFNSTDEDSIISKSTNGYYSYSSESDLNESDVEITRKNSSIRFTNFIRKFSTMAEIDLEEFYKEAAELNLTNLKYTGKISTLLLFLLRIGFKKLKNLKVQSPFENQSEFYNQLKEFNKYESVAVFRSLSFDADEHEKQNPTLEKKFGNLFRKLYFHGWYIVLKNDVNEWITSDQISNYDKFNTIMASNRNIKSIKIDFGSIASNCEHEKVLKILKKYENNLVEIILSGTIKDIDLKNILKCIKNCKVLIFDNLQTVKMAEVKGRVKFPNLEVLEVKNMSNKNCLKFIKLPKNCLKKFKCRREKNFNEILKNQKSLENISILTSNRIKKGFLTDCKPKKLSLSFNNIVKLSYENFIKTQPQLEQLKLSRIWNSMFKTITIELLNLQKLEFNVGNLSHEDFKLISTLGKLKELHMNSIRGNWKNKIENCNSKSLEILKLQNIKIPNVSQQLSLAFPNLKMLNLTRISTNYKNFYENLDKLKNLNSLVIKNSIFIDKEKIPNYIEKLKTFEFPQNQLKEFYMQSDLHSDEEFIKKFMNGFKNLEKLSISIYENETTLDQLKILLNLQNHLEYVDIKIKYHTKIKFKAISTNEFLFILKKENIKFLLIDGLVIDDPDNFIKVFRQHFQVVKVLNGEYAKILLMKNETIDEFERIKNTKNESWINSVLNSKNSKILF